MANTRTPKTFLFWRKVYRPHKNRRRIGPIAIGNTLRCIASKSAGSKALYEQQKLFGSVQVGCGTKRGAENSLNRETMLNHVFSNRPELYNYTHCAFSKSSYLIYGSSVIMSEDGTQQGDPEAPPLYAGNNSVTRQKVVV